MYGRHSSRGAHQIVDDVRMVVDCLVHHEAKDAHLCRAAVVELDRLECSGSTRGKRGGNGGQPNMGRTLLRNVSALWRGESKITGHSTSVQTLRCTYY